MDVAHYESRINLREKSRLGELAQGTWKERSRSVEMMVLEHSLRTYTPKNIVPSFLPIW